jgi:hypothetical protein
LQRRRRERDEPLLFGAPARRKAPPCRSWWPSAPPGYDIHALHQEWQAFAERQGKPVKNPDQAFLGFCRERHRRAPFI